jgi:predicted SAM-dependent methyltransferase
VVGLASKLCRTRCNMYVQYGCQWCAPDSWINFDASPTLRFERFPLVGKLYTKNRNRFPDNVRYGDVVRGLPVPDESCDGVYCSHVLEHLSLEDFDKAIRETFRILKPGGIFRLVVPDLQIHAETYLEELHNNDSEANCHFMTSTCLGVEKRRRNLTHFLYDWLGNSRHLWMWDYRSLEYKLKQHGFEAIGRAQFNDCDDPAFRAVENEGRFEGACAVQATRPAGGGACMQPVATDACNRV